MAGVDTKDNGGIVAATAGDGDSHDLKTILAGDERDFLVRNNGDQVKISELDGKIVGLYFSGSWCGPCRRFTPTLVEAYEGLSAKGNFEVIFISSDRDEESFTQYFSKMPWLAIPFSDSTTIKSVKQLFKVRGIPHLVILGPKGNVLSEEGVQIVGDHGVEAYPFSPERMKELEEQEKAAKENQTLTSLLASSRRDFVISSDGTKVPISELEGKTVGLYFSLYPVPGSRKFIKKLAVVYNKLRERGENFEVVTIPLDDKENSFKEGLGEMPWLSLPFMDKKCFKLIPYFELQTLPTLIIIGPDGKTLTSNVAELIEEHGDQAYPFSPEKLAELAEVEKARLDAQTLESLLVSGELDYVIGKDDVKVPVADLVGKNILFYFSAHWCGPCRAFLPSLIKAYEEIKATDKAFELIFVSSDRDESAFQDYFSGMPWLALPFEDKRCDFLSRKFKILGIPSLIAIGPTGRTVTTEARDLLAEHGSKAYPFTEEHIAAMEARMEEMEKGWPEKVRSASHAEHELVLTRRRGYVCDGCNTAGRRRSYYCKECDFDLHPKCYFEEIEVKKDEGEEEASKVGLVCDGEKVEGKEGEANKDGWVCDGEVCHKVE